MSSDRVSVRMRLRYDQAGLLYRLLDDERHRMTIERGRWKAAVETKSFNAVLALLDATKEELLRAADDGGWDLDGEPREPHTAAASARPPGEVARRVDQRYGTGD